MNRSGIGTKNTAGEQIIVFLLLLKIMNTSLPTRTGLYRFQIRKKCGHRIHFRNKQTLFGLNYIYI